MANYRAQQSCLLVTPAASSGPAQTFFASKLRDETDPADVYADMQKRVVDFVLLDVRSPEAYAKSHAPGTIYLPQSMINAETIAHFAKGTLLVVYCGGAGCNGTTKAALKLSTFGFAVKEMIGGIEYWENKEHYPVERGGTPASGQPSAL